MSPVDLDPPRRQVELTIDGQSTRVPEGTTLLQACESLGIDTPTLCYLSTLTPANVCRVCVVELESARTLVPACSRVAEAGMVVSTDSDRVRASRRGVLELLASSVDLSAADPQVARWQERYGADPDRYGAAARRHDPAVLVDNEMYVRDYARCILCYKCVDACGEQAQNTFAIAVAGRGFDATISTEFEAALPDSACVYCGNCVAVCPTGALMTRSEHDLRRDGAWAPDRQTVTSTICPYCGVGCTVDLHVQDNRIVSVTSPLDSPVTRGNLCVKGRFGYGFVQDRAGTGE
ncbi:MAG: 2Fe-2S iron-sulfur cluster-binding protein [Actinomycetes bacterium]